MKQLLITIDEKTNETELKSSGLDAYQILGLLEYFKNQVLHSIGKAETQNKKP